MAALKGSPEQRRAIKDANRRVNRVAHIKAAAATGDGHALVVAATQAAKAVSRRIEAIATPAVALARQQRLARALIEVVDRFDSEEKAR